MLLISNLTSGSVLVFCRHFHLFRKFRIFALKNSTSINYVQGQSPTPNTREYFYYIDHQGMLFLDDSKMKNFTSCFKEKKFLAFFFKRLRINDSGKYDKEFPYVSPCGREMNFVRCDDLPIVFTHILEVGDHGTESTDWLSYGHAGDLLKVKFEPTKLCMPSYSGRLYHPAHEAVGGVGLVKSSLTIELSKHFTYRGDNTDEMPIAFTWKGKKYALTNEILDRLKDVNYS